MANTNELAAVFASRRALEWTDEQKGDRTYMKKEVEHAFLQGVACGVKLASPPEPLPPAKNLTWWRKLYLKAFG